MDGLRVPMGRPLLGAAGRRPAGVLAGGCAIVVAGLGLLFAGQSSADRFDGALDAPVISWLGGRGTLLGWMAWPGTLVPAVVISAAIALACLVAGRLNGAILAVAAVPAATGLADGVLKHLIHRTYLGQLTFPSGHTATVFALAATVAVLVIPERPGTAGLLRTGIPVLACLAGAVVAVAVIALRWHYFTDTVAGAAAGIGTVCLLALILDLPAARRLLTGSGV